MEKIECPDWLDETAKKEWEKLAPELIEDGILTNRTASMFAAYCTAFSRWMAAEKCIQERGSLICAKNGFPIIAPQVNIASGLYSTMMKLADEFGLTPASLSRISGGNVATDDPARTKTNGFLELVK